MVLKMQNGSRMLFLMSILNTDEYDYTNLVRTFDKYFSEFVILETTNEELLNKLTRGAILTKQVVTDEYRW